MDKRIDSKISRTAEMTCASRAASALETNPYYHSDDAVSLQLLPTFLRRLMALPPARKALMHQMAPKGMYEYVIARTKTIDATVAQALVEHFDQILVLGAGFDTRAIRFTNLAGAARFFELDSPITQQAKIQQLEKRHVPIPANLTWIAIDFDRESLPEKLEQSGFCKGQKSLFVLEGLTMYLQAESIDATFRTLQSFSGPGSRVVFDFVDAAVLANSHALEGSADVVQRVSNVGEQWQFGLHPAQLADFLARYDLTLLGCQDSHALEAAWFTQPDGEKVAWVNPSHYLATAQWGPFNEAHRTGVQ